MRFIFPFDAVDKGSRIILYGAGIVGRQFLSQIKTTNYCDCLFFADRNHWKYQHDIGAISICSPEKIIGADYDYIVISSTKYVDEIHDSLINIGVSCEKIIKSIRRVDAFADELYIYIDEYPYTHRYRASLADSKIREILNNWWTDNENETLELVKEFCSFISNYERIPIESSGTDSIKWLNAWIPPFDAVSIYGFLAKRNPRYYVEVGSGNTTLFAARSIADNRLRTQIISIDPHPRASIDTLCYKIHRMPLEDMDISFFKGLSSDDVLLLDNSHRAFQNSDVTVFFTEILPELPAGLLYALHDILLPHDYPEGWLERWYNEQYMLCSYLLGGACGDRIMLSNNYISSQSSAFEACRSLWGDGHYLSSTPFGGGFFWMEKA